MPIRYRDAIGAYRDSLKIVGGGVGGGVGCDDDDNDDNVPVPDRCRTEPSLLVLPPAATWHHGVERAPKSRKEELPCRGSSRNRTRANPSRIRCPGSGGVHSNAIRCWETVLSSCLKNELPPSATE
uniref:Uncharacterized protein n=1 Tax=Anopheles farauti TaxID=69004 RepID=A0A182QRB4_9DIPT